MAFRSKTYQLFTKAESAFGTFADPLIRPGYTGVQKERLQNVTWSVDPETEDSTFLTGTAAQSYSLIGKRPGKLSYEMLLAPAEFTKDTSPTPETNQHIFEGEVFYNAVGLEVVNVLPIGMNDPLLYSQPMTRVLYPSKSAWSKSISHAGVVQNVATGIGKGVDFNGVMGTAVISTAGVGKPVNIKFDMQGGTDGLTANNGEDYDIAKVDMDKLTFDPSNIIDGIANKYMNATVKIIKSSAYDPAKGYDVSLYTAGDAIAVCTNKMELNFGNTVNPVDCQAAKSGLQGYTITDAKPTLKINPFMTTKAEFDFFKGLVRETTFVIAIEYNNTYTFDNNSYKPLVIVVPNAQIESMPSMDDNTLLRYDMSFKCLGNWNQVTPLITVVDDDGLGSDDFVLPNTVERFEMAFWLEISEDYKAEQAMS